MARCFDEGLRAVDERLIVPGNRYEVIDGLLYYVPPSPLRAIRRSKVATLAGVHAHPDFTVAIDMLTRTSRLDDLPPDVSIFARARSLLTGGRHLERIAFLVVTDESLAPTDLATIKARKLADRGVRRVLAIDVATDRVFEWTLGTWSPLDPTVSIKDPALALPLPVAGLLDNTSALG